MSWIVIQVIPIAMIWGGKVGWSLVSLYERVLERCEGNVELFWRIEYGVPWANWGFVRVWRVLVPD